MEIQLEKNSSTEALIKINLKEADYQPKFKEFPVRSLEEFRNFPITPKEEFEKFV